jgi:hypothetical protein
MVTELDLACHESIDSPDAGHFFWPNLDPRTATAATNAASHSQRSVFFDIWF